ncbi:MAG: phosphoribosylamine--glycine ligase [Chloroflexota bacterium]|nr:phosphoribosylamine--glycine ligase [Chloroflexota bacterium]
MTSRVLIVGNGAREHALAWKIAQSPNCAELIVAPGNAGTADGFRNIVIPATDMDGIVALAANERIDLVVVGPEEPLAHGLADALRARDIACFGPNRDGARIESSKAWTKDLLHRAGVPTAHAETFSDVQRALPALEEVSYPVVIKADGLAAGKGVTICATRGEAESAVRKSLEGGAFGAAGQTVLIEEFLTGDEVSVLALVDGETVVPLLPARDHKRIGEGDTGPNTGGMGAYAPTTLVDDALLARIMETILRPTARALVEKGIIYRGVLYAGLILTADGPKVIEYNCRFGDPETQVILPLLDADLLALCAATATGRLAGSADTVRWHPGACVGVVLASGGYPGTYPTGRPITGLDTLDTAALVFHAGTKKDEDRGIVTSGGRVLTVAAVAPTLREARDRAYASAERIHFDGATYRRDIAARELPDDSVFPVA